MARLASERGPTLLVDLGSDVPLVLGIDPPVRGLRQWGAAASPPPDGLSRLEVELTPTLSLLPAGVSTAAPEPGQLPERDEVPEWDEVPEPDAVSHPAAEVDDSQVEPVPIPAPAPSLDAETSDLLAALLVRQKRRVVVDAGTVGPGLDGAAPTLVGAATRSYAVTRACYLAVARSVRLPRPDGLVVIREPGRLLADDDLATAWASPVVVSLRWDAAVAAATDVGTLGRQVPRSLRRLLPLLAAEAAAS
jgi:hypothetical protein